ncbi:MAG: glycosyltransferase [Candidatus Accumulibacter sp.]|uniref:Glycosyltransferase n=1 Tax=Candidatus Accumulibacter proximus TaxID=2954385 RepID=A0A935PXD3_9PROT|nr:glycosyltransferase [Candidatus Accumulibacter proximus]
MTEKLLLVSPATPFEPQSGAQQRTALLHEALQALGEVDVLLLEPTSGPSHLAPAKPGILAHGFWHQRPLGIGKYAPDRALNQALRAAGLDLNRYQLIVSRYLNPITKLAVPPGARTVVDLDDWGYHYAPGTLALAARLKSNYAAWLAQRQLNRFDAYFFVSKRDQARHPELSAVILPNIPFNPPAQPYPQTDSSTLLFVGSLWYAPNREGIDRFLARCWPAIKAAQPKARLLLVGAASAGIRKAWEKYPDVSAPGFVDDLGDAYRNAAFTIAPIYSGGGTNIKVLESLAYGRACVTTPHCADAFEKDLAHGLSVAGDDATLVRLCIELLCNERFRKAGVISCTDTLQHTYTKAAFMRQASRLLRPLWQRQ